MNFSDYENSWMQRYLVLHKKKPTKMERTAFAVGFDAACHMNMIKQKTRREE